MRVRDPEAVARLRAGIGMPLLDHANPIGRHLLAMSPDRVFLARIGRIEVYAPIPGPGGTGPEGPHTHVLPKLLRSGRTRAAATPIPAGWVPCAGLHPAHPYKDMMGERIAFDAGRHEAFQALLDRWGDPELVTIKRGGPEAPGGTVSSRHAQGARRIAEAQARYRRGEIIEGSASDNEDDEATA